MLQNKFETCILLAVLNECWNVCVIGAPPEARTIFVWEPKDGELL